MQEPANGDFVAYIEALQKESAARLARERASVAEPPASKKAGGRFFEEGAKSASRNSRQDGERFVLQDGAQSAVTALASAVAGTAFLLVWLGRGGPFPLLLAVALLAYGVPRLVKALTTLTVQPSDKVAIDHVFGRTGREP